PPEFDCGGNVALVNFAGVSGLTLRIANSLLTGGTALGIASSSGGNLCVMSSRLVLDRSVLTGGFADSGGGLYGLSLADGSSIVLSTISGNTADDSGAGIAAEGPLGDLTIES